MISEEAVGFGVPPSASSSCMHFNIWAFVCSSKLSPFLVPFEEIASSSSTSLSAKLKARHCWFRLLDVPLACTKLALPPPPLLASSGACWYGLLFTQCPTQLSFLNRPALVPTPETNITSSRRLVVASWSSLDCVLPRNARFRSKLSLVHTCSKLSLALLILMAGFALWL